MVTGYTKDGADAAIAAAVAPKADASALTAEVARATAAEQANAAEVARKVTAAQAADAAPVQSVAGRTGVVTLAKADVGLAQVDNTADADKPVSTAQAAATAASAIQRAGMLAKAARARWAGAQRIALPITKTALQTSSVSWLERSLGTVTGTSATNTFSTSSAHGMVVGDGVRFSNKTGLSFINGSPYYVSAVPTSTTFQVYASNGTSGGTASLGSDGTATGTTNLATTYASWDTSALTATITAVDDTFTTATPHGLAVGNAISLSSVTAGGVSNTTDVARYYIKAVLSDTQFTVASTVNGPTVDVTADGTATVGTASKHMRFVGGRPIQSSQFSPRSDLADWDFNTTTTGAGTASVGVLTWISQVDVQQIEFIVRNRGSGSVRIVLDDGYSDVITTAALTAAGIAVGQHASIAYTFPTKGLRQVRVEGGGVGFRLPRNSAAPVKPTFVTPRWMVCGDSFTEGTGDTSAFGGFVQWLTRYTTFRDVVRAGSGSTGYLNNGTRVNLISRYQTDLINQAPDGLIIAHGINDSGLVLSDVVAAASTIWDAYVAALPFSPLIVVGPFPNGGGVGVTQTIIDLDAALGVAAKARGLYFYSPVQEGLTFTRSDATHPDPAGHQTIGAWLAGHLIRDGFASAA